MAETHREEIAKLEALYAAHPEGRVFTHLAEAHRKAGDLEQARQILEQGLARHPDYSSAHVVLGRVLIDLGERDAAADAFRHVLELDRHNLVALRTLGGIAAESGRKEEALRHYRDLQALDPTDDRLRTTIRDLETMPAVDEIGAQEPVESGAATAEATRAEAPEEPQESAGEERPVPDAGPAWPDEVPVDSAFPAEAIDLSGFEALEEEPAEPVPLSPDWGAIGEPRELLPGDLASLAGEAPAEAEEGVEGDLTAWAFEVEQEAEEASFEEESFTPPDREEADTPMPPAEIFGADRRVDAPPATPEDVADVVEAEVLASQDDVRLEGEAEPAADSAREERAEVGDLSVGTTDGEVLTVTMAELYANQGIYDRAAEVYRSLLQQVPDDPRLREGLAQMEARLHGSVRRGVEAEAEEVAADEMIADEWESGEAEPPAQEAWLESVESAWTGGGGVAGSEETPYAWAHGAPREESGGPPVAEYFRSLLGWRPQAYEPTVAYELREPAESEGAESGQTEELNVAGLEPQESGPDAGEDEMVLEAGAVEAAFEEWFGPESGAPKAEAQPRDGEEAASSEDEADADLEMFRSWLQSLKK